MKFLYISEFSTLTFNEVQTEPAVQRETIKSCLPLDALRHIFSFRVLLATFFVCFDKI